MKNLFSLLLAVMTIFSFSLNAQEMMHKESMADKSEMMEKAAPTIIQLSQIEGEYTTQLLNLTPGDYIFEVTNTEVDKGLGFYLQDKTEAQVTNSGLAALVKKGETSRTGVVTLIEGSYNYSCPINPTPAYTINVGAPQVIKLSQKKGVYNEGNLDLAPGYYVFEVTNKKVAKELGFYLQDEAGAQVKDSGLKALVDKGETNTSGVVYLTAGNYQYSCPLNPTPKYTVSVK
ncbi:MAG: hypothetical protein ACJAZ9_000880 [Neolewinella sp.]|jgi:hypothetical protein